MTTSGKDPIAIAPELVKKRKLLLGIAIKDAVKQYRNSRSLADAILLMIEQYRKEEKELKLEAFKKPSRFDSANAAKEIMVVPQFETYREVKSGVK